MKMYSEIKKVAHDAEKAGLVKTAALLREAVKMLITEERLYTHVMAAGQIYYTPETGKSALVTVHAEICGCPDTENCISAFYVKRPLTT